MALSVVVLANSALSQWLAQRSAEWRGFAIEFVAMAAFNYLVLLAYIVLRSGFNAEIEDGGAAFFIVLLFTLVLTLYDRFQHLATGLQHDRPLRVGGRD